jgi:recombination protein RecT
MKANGEDYKRTGSSSTGTGTSLRPVKEMLSDTYVKTKFNEVMGAKAAAFMASVANIVTTNYNLNKCNPTSVISAALVAATLDLPIDPNLGFSAIIPYNGKNGYVAQFQIMYKGFVQLAMRTEQYQTMNVTSVYKDEIKSNNLITGEVVIESVEGGYRDLEREDMLAGYAAYFKLIKGFEKTVYWPVKKLEAHGKKYSKSYSNYPESSLWSTNKPAMYSKTVLKDLISKWGIMSTTMQNAVMVDQGVIRNINNEITSDNIEYPDNDGEPEKLENVPEEKSVKQEIPKEEQKKEDIQKPVIIEQKTETKTETTVVPENRELPDFPEDVVSKVFDEPVQGNFDIF